MASFMNFEVHARYGDGRVQDRIKDEEYLPVDFEEIYENFQREHRWKSVPSTLRIYPPFVYV